MGSEGVWNTSDGAQLTDKVVQLGLELEQVALHLLCCFFLCVFVKPVRGSGEQAPSLTETSPQKKKTHAKREREKKHRTFRFSVSMA